MKKAVGLAIAISFLVACSDDSSSNTSEVEAIEKTEKVESVEKDTVFSYQKFSYDTTSTIDSITVLENPYIVELTTYSLNDSSIVRRLRDEEVDDKTIHIDLGHQTTSHIRFVKDSIAIERQVDRRDFEPFLHKGFYKECDMISTKLGSVYSNRISFYSDFTVPKTDFVWRVRYYYAVENDSTINDLELIDVKYLD